MCAKKNEDIIKLDETDIKILKIINDDVRISYRQISRDLGISVGTVHNRIDKMLKSGVIEKFAPVLNHKKLGYALTSIIGVNVKGKEFPVYVDENGNFFDETSIDTLNRLMQNVPEEDLLPWMRKKGK